MDNISERQTYTVTFPNVLIPVGRFSLKGEGRLFIDNELGVLMLSDDETLSFWEKLPGKAAKHLPIFGIVMQAVLDDIFRDVFDETVHVPKSSIRDIRRDGLNLSFLAPTKFGSRRMKRVDVSTLSEVTAIEIENALRASARRQITREQDSPYLKREEVELGTLAKSLALFLLSCLLFLSAVAAVVWGVSRYGSTVGLAVLGVIVLLALVLILRSAFGDHSHGGVSIRLDRDQR